LQTEEEKNCRTVRSRPDLQNREEVVRIDLSVLLVIQSLIYIPGWLGGARENCCPQRFKWVLEHRELQLPSGYNQRNQGGRVVQGRTSVLCYTGWSLCNWKLVLPSSWCWNIRGVGARETRESVLSNKLQLVKQR
jgi:hypothetical protein